MTLALAAVSVDRVDDADDADLERPRVTIVSSRIHGTSRPSVKRTLAPRTS